MHLDSPTLTFPLHEKGKLIIRHLGTQPYQQVWRDMQAFTDQRDDATADEIWLVEHPAVFTQGQAGKPEHLLNPGDIPVIQTDRGGQVTFHGPGQLVVYVLVNLQRLKISTRQLVRLLEQSVINVLVDFNIESTTKTDAPGVYVGAAKICSIGLRVRKGCSYHGLAFNIDMDLEPFSRINPCGYQGLQVTQLSQFVSPINPKEIETKIIKQLVKNFGYNLPHESNT